MQDLVKSIVGSIAGHLALDPHRGQAIPLDIAKQFRPRSDTGKCRPPGNARFARIHTADRLAMMELATTTWLVGKPPTPADVSAVVDAAISGLVPGGPAGLANPSPGDVRAYFWLGGKKTDVVCKVAQLNSDQKRKLTQALTQLLDTSRAEGLPQPEALRPTAADEEPFDPNNEEDARERITRTIIQRRGQKRFRDLLLLAYEGKCAITGCSILDILEAAHIVPHRGKHTDTTPNGLLLRADLHTLFDCQLLAIDPDTKKVLLAPRIAESEYKEWYGRRIRLPKNTRVQPNTEALRKHLEACRSAWGESKWSQQQ